MRIDRHHDRVARPWKNGGGVTRELAAFPADAGMDDFGWRVSLAEVAAAGPFSVFPGVDRSLTMVEGRMALSVGGAAPVVLSPEVGPHAFPGDVAAFGEPLDGPARDLNVMTRRGAWRAEVTRLAIGSGAEIEAGADVVMLLAMGELRIATATERSPLSRLDAALLEPGETATLSPTSREGAAWLVRLSAAGRRLRND